MTRRLLAATTIALAAVAAAGCGGSSKLASGDIAQVCGEHVTKANYDQLLNQQKAQLGGKLPKAGTTQYETLKQQIVSLLAQKAAYQHKADQLDIKVSDKEVDDQLQLIISQQFGGKKATFLKAIKKQGYTEEQARAVVRFNVVEKKLHDKIINDVKVSEKDERAYYAQNKASYATKEQREVAHILVKTKAKADAIEKQIAAGGDFAKLAKKYSIDTGSGANGGKLTDTKGLYVKPFEQVAFKLKTGEVSEPVKSQFGYHIIKALKPTQPAHTQSFDEVKAQIAATLSGKKQQEAVTKWVNDVKKECVDKAKYAAGYNPPGTKATPGSAFTKTS
jgi:foldase protein PrsA